VLCAVGDLVEDVVVRLGEPIRHATDTPARIERTRGGSAANVAAFAAAAGTPARFIGAVGDDDAGERLITDLAAGGVDVRARRTGRTGTIVVLVDEGGERTMLTDRGAAVALADVPADWLDGVRWLHLPAYSLTVEPLGRTAHRLATIARRGGARLSVDVSSVAVVGEYGTDRFAADLETLRPDVVFANAAEAELLPSGVPAREAVVVKHGREPVEVRLSDGTTSHVAPVDSVGVVDTTGAGDAFAAGFIGARLDGATLTEAARAGTRLAARVLGSSGASLASGRDRTR
jgi:sugar/nucleoside kinase (ribokinase family)